MYNVFLSCSLHTHTSWPLLNSNIWLNSNEGLKIFFINLKTHQITYLVSPEDRFIFLWFPGINKDIFSNRYSIMNHCMVKCADPVTSHSLVRAGGDMYRYVPHQQLPPLPHCTDGISIEEGPVVVVRECAIIWQRATVHWYGASLRLSHATLRPSLVVYSLPYRNN